MKNVSILTSKLLLQGTDVNAVLRRPVQRKTVLGTLFFQVFHRFRKSFCISYIVSIPNHKPNSFSSEPVFYESEGTF